MRGVQATYRMTVATTTQLAQPLGQYDDVIYLVDASTQGEPNLAANIWGVLTVNGERIMYRERDTVNNTISSLLRGTAGTAAASHDIGSTVYSGTWQSLARAVSKLHCQQHVYVRWHHS